jgi:hypothetical protein
VTSGSKVRATGVCGGIGSGSRRHEMNCCCLLLQNLGTWCWWCGVVFSWSFLEYLRIRKALKANQPDARGSRRGLAEVTLATPTMQAVKTQNVCPNLGRMWGTVFVELSHRILFARAPSINLVDLDVCRTHAPPRPVARTPALLPRGTRYKWL